VAPQIPDGGTPDWVVFHRNRRNNKPRSNLVLVVEVKRWSERGSPTAARRLRDKMKEYIEARFDQTTNDVIYGLGDIGLKWIVWKVLSNSNQIEEVTVGWEEDISTDVSFGNLQTIMQQHV
jgi:hypothetical protein